MGNWKSLVVISEIPICSVPVLIHGAYLAACEHGNTEIEMFGVSSGLKL